MHRIAHRPGTVVEFAWIRLGVSHDIGHFLVFAVCGGGKEKIVLNIQKEQARLPLYLLFKICIANDQAIGFLASSQPGRVGLRT